jgi:integrase
MGKLTVRAIEAAKARDKPYKLMDGEGLQVRVATDGVKTFLVRFMLRGAEHQHRLLRPFGASESNETFTLSQARSEAFRIRELAKLGIDHELQRQQDIAAQEAERKASEERKTIKQLFERWHELELSNRKDGGAEIKRAFQKDVLPQLGDRHADDIKRGDVMAVLDGVKGRGANRLANRMLSELRQMFGFALVRDIVAADPTYRITKRDVGGKDVERERVLSEAEIRAFPAALDSANLLKSTKHAVWIMMATGARIGEVTRTRRTDLDLTADTWTIPKEHAKNEREHVIYLSAFAKGHFEALLALSHDDTWVMPARHTDGPVCSKSMTKQIGDRQLIHVKREAHKNRTAHAHALELTGGKWTPHDLRRTAGTIMGELGVDSDVIVKCLNQTEELKVKRIYQRHVRLNDQIEAWRLLGAHLELLTEQHRDFIPPSLDATA